MASFPRTYRLLERAWQRSTVRYLRSPQPNCVRHGHVNNKGLSSGLGDRHVPSVFKFPSTTSTLLALSGGVVAMSGMCWLSGSEADPKVIGVHVWRADFLIKENVLDGSACYPPLVLSSNKSTLTRGETMEKVEYGNWARKDESSVVATPEIFANVVESYEEGFRCPNRVYIMIHGGQTV